MLKFPRSNKKVRVFRFEDYVVFESRACFCVIATEGLHWEQDLVDLAHKRMMSGKPCYIEGKPTPAVWPISQRTYLM